MPWQVIVFARLSVLGSSRPVEHLLKTPQAQSRRHRFFDASSSKKALTGQCRPRCLIVQLEAGPCSPARIRTITGARYSPPNPLKPLRLLPPSIRADGCLGPVSKCFCCKSTMFCRACTEDAVILGSASGAKGPDAASFASHSVLGGRPSRVEPARVRDGARGGSQLFQARVLTVPRYQCEHCLMILLTYELILETRTSTSSPSLNDYLSIYAKRSSRTWFKIR